MLDEIKVLLSITDTEQDALLKLLIKDSKQRILTILNGVNVLYNTVPTSLEYIVVDVTLKRFNKLEDEGSTTSKNGDFTIVWEKNFLDEHKSILESYRNKASLSQSPTGVARPTFI